MSGCRDYNIDILKFLGCIGVVGLHTLSQYKYIYILCAFAVPLFFMISGYLLLSKQEMSLRYILMKILGIVRLIVLWNLVVMVISFRMQFSLESYFKQCLYSIFQKGLPYLSHLWYLGALMFMYMILPFINKILAYKGKDGYRKRLLYLSACFILINLFLNIISFILHQNVDYKVIISCRLWIWFESFLLGGLICFYREKLLLLFKVKIAWLILFILMILVPIYDSLLGTKIFHNTMPEIFYNNTLNVILNTCIFIVILTRDLSKYVINFIEAFKDLPLGVYLVHVPLCFLVKDFHWKPILMYIIILFGSILIVRVLSKVKIIKKILFTI